MIRSEIDIERIDRRLDDLWEIGKTERGGVTRLAYSPEETEAMEYILGELGDDISVEADSIGNLFMMPEPDAAKSFYIGSHLDTVFNGGRLDGTLGVVVALEAMEVLRSSEAEPPVSPTLCIFRAEESARFGKATLGSKGALGMLTVDDFSATDQGEVPLWQAMQQEGFRPQNLSEPTIDLESVGCFLELHIEQGRVLEEKGDNIGLVTSIRAPVRYEVAVMGDDDHSGATPMELRRDAIAGAADMIRAIERIGTSAAEKGDIVTTVGDIEAPEGAINKVCGRARFLLDIRSNDARYRDDIESSILDRFHEIANERELEVDTQLAGRSDPVDLDSAMLEFLEEVAEDTETSARRLPSGGGHDAMNFQHAGIPTGMLFVPSVDGISHNPREETHSEAVRDAAEMFTRAILRGPPDTSEGSSREISR